MLKIVQMPKKYAALHFYKNVITKMGFLISNISAMIPSFYIISLKIYYPSSSRDSTYVHFSFTAVFCSINFI